MHGTVVMLMALSGLGCHHKHADVAYVPSCYTSSYDSCYTSSYEPSCYSGCYSSSEYIGGCYSSSCYSETSYGDAWPSCYSEKRCFLKKLFHCGGGGLFKKHHRKYYAPIETSCYSSCYSGGYSSVYEPPVFGTSMPIYETPYGSAQVPSKSLNSAPAAPAAAPAAAPSLAPKATEAEPTSATSTLPPPPPTPASAVEDAVKSITPDVPGLSPAPNAQP